MEQFNQPINDEASVLAYGLVLSPSNEVAINPPTDREKQLFSPIETMPTQDHSSEDYDDLFNPNIEPVMSVEGAGVRPKPRQVTAETEEEAVKTIELTISQDAFLGHILTDYVKRQNISAKDIPRALRMDLDLRLSVGTHLIDKISRLIAELPWRIQNNTQKNPNEGGYEELGYLTSREYTALLALSMLDGSFSSQREGSDTITYDPERGDGLGQHRYAARKILHSS